MKIEMGNNSSSWESVESEIEAAIIVTAQSARWFFFSSRKPSLSRTRHDQTNSLRYTQKQVEPKMATSLTDRERRKNKWEKETK